VKLLHWISVHAVCVIFREEDVSCAARDPESVDFLNKSFIPRGNILKLKGKRVKIPTCFLFEM